VAGAGPAAVRPILERPRQGRKIAGVCLAVARYLEVDVTLVRILWVLLIFVGGGGIVAYLVGWLIIPEEPLAALAAPPPVNGQQNPSQF
jgi:phage shock protein PspC (stress-responsive transcriptional regulator)